MQTAPLRPPARVSSSWRVGIVHASFYPDEVMNLVQGAERVLREAGLLQSNIRRFPVPGSFEIPLVGAALLEAKEVDALLGIGIIVEGETHHARLIAEAVAHGIMDVQLKYCAPFAFEVLFVKNIEQARARAGAMGNKGEEAAIAVLHSLAQLGPLRS